MWNECQEENYHKKYTELKSKIEFKAPTKKSYEGDRVNLHHMDEIGCFSEVKINDDYRHLKFKQPTDIYELKVGMMVQIVERNEHALCWKWVELTEKIILVINAKKDGLIWVRLPNYA